MTMNHPTSDSDAIANSNDWREAVRDLIDYRVAQGECFSSGEIAATIREHRMDDLKFSVRRLGEYVRDLFYTGQMPSYEVEDEDGEVEEIAPMQVSRFTQGTGRTPAGQEVFVYGPMQESCDDHDFEVDIPVPPGVSAPAPAPAALPSGGPLPSGYPTQIAAAVAPAPAPTPASKPSNGDLTVKVIADCRAVVYRSVFEAWVHHAKKSMRAGDPVYIRFDNDKAFISLDDPGDGATHQLHQGTRPGRVFFASPKSPFKPGDEYGVKFTDDALVIDISAPVS